MKGNKMALTCFMDDKDEYAYVNENDLSDGERDFCQRVLNSDESSSDEAAQVTYKSELTIDKRTGVRKYSRGILKMRTLNSSQK